MFIKIILLIYVIFIGLFQYDAPTPRVSSDYTDTSAGFTLSYPVYWEITTDIDEILSIQDGDIDLIHEENLTDAERAAYKVLVHVSGNPDYVSNIAVLVHSLNANGTARYNDSESAVQAVASDFDRNRESGTFLLEETYLGESHTFVYRRNVDIEGWSDDIRITYYLTASTSKAYMLVETAHVSELSDVDVDQLNQAIQSFRVMANETGSLDPSLDWGAFKPGEDTENPVSSDIGRVQILEEFDNNRNGWPVSDDSRVADGQYILDSTKGFPFTVRNTGMGQIAFDFECLGDVTFIDGDETAGYGIVFGYRDDDNYFAFLVTQSGQWLAIEERNGVVEQLVPWTESQFLDGDTHTLRVAGDYQTLNEPELTHRYAVFFYIDDNPVGNIRVNRVLDMSGWYGVFVSSDLLVGFNWFETKNYLEDAIMTLDRYE
ncbi:MAG: hypothetical protein NTY09_03170 [bacterium]|nr:hypothetical protein [bacterium]